MASPDPIAWGGIRLDVGRGRASLDGTDLDLTRTEFRLLHGLLARAGQTLSRAELVDVATRGEGSIGERTVDVHVCALRRKLGPRRRIETVRGVGYRFAVDPAPGPDPTGD